METQAPTPVQAPVAQAPIAQAPVAPVQTQVPQEVAQAVQNTGALGENTVQYQEKINEQAASQNRMPPKKNVVDHLPTSHKGTLNGDLQQLIIEQSAGDPNTANSMLQQIKGLQEGRMSDDNIVQLMRSRQVNPPQQQIQQTEKVNNAMKSSEFDRLLSQFESMIVTNPQGVNQEETQEDPAPTGQTEVGTPTEGQETNEATTESQVEAEGAEGQAKAEGVVEVNSEILSDLIRNAQKLQLEKETLEHENLLLKDKQKEYLKERIDGEKKFILDGEQQELISSINNYVSNPGNALYLDKLLNVVYQNFGDAEHGLGLFNKDAIDQFYLKQAKQSGRQVYQKPKKKLNAVDYLPGGRI